MNQALKYALLTALTFFLVNQAFANPCPPGNPPTNCAPPTGAIFDLAGGPVPHQYQQYNTSFTAVATTTNISFSFREDPAFLGLDDVVVRLGAGPNLLTNGDFESGVVGQNAPVGWTYLNAFGAAAAGVVANSGTPGAHGGSNYYRDGAVQAYDGITQAIATTVGATYNIEFWLSDNSSLSTFSRLSTNGNISDAGGNGIDMLVYAGVVPTLAVPEPETYAMLLAGLGLLGFIARRRKQNAA
jgi:hypothetical protein